MVRDFPHPPQYFPGLMWVFLKIALLSRRDPLGFDTSWLRDSSIIRVYMLSSAVGFVLGVGKVR